MNRCYSEEIKNATAIDDTFKIKSIIRDIYLSLKL